MPKSTTLSGPLPDPELVPVMKPEVARHFIGLGRSAMYDAIKRGEVPSIRLGRLVMIPTASLRHLLQLGQPESSRAADADSPEV